MGLKDKLGKNYILGNKSDARGAKKKRTLRKISSCSYRRKMSPQKKAGGKREKGNGSKKKKS